MSHRVHPLEPARRAIANLPTRLEPLAAGLPVPTWIKRDDHTGSELSGNKLRKLEYLLADALAQGADTVITCGGEQSNHARATAIAAATVGLRSVLVLRCDDPATPPAPTGNILLDRLVGAEIRWITRPAWKRRTELMAEEADRVRRAGGTPYVIPEGGSNALGSWGYIRCAQELLTQLADLPRPTTIVYACGSGGTGAGLVLGARLLGFADRGIRVAGINVCDDRAYFVDAIGRICADACAQWSLGITIDERDIEILDGHVGLGYARSQATELSTMRDLCRRTGVFLDPVYTGKAFHGLTQELAADPTRLGASVVFLHTGGIFGLFGADAAALLGG